MRRGAVSISQCASPGSRPSARPSFPRDAERVPLSPGTIRGTVDPSLCWDTRACRFSGTALCGSACAGAGAFTEALRSVPLQPGLGFSGSLVRRVPRPAVAVRAETCPEFGWDQLVQNVSVSSEMRSPAAAARGRSRGLWPLPWSVAAMTPAPSPSSRAAHVPGSVRVPAVCVWLPSPAPWGRVVTVCVLGRLLTLT